MSMCHYAKDHNDNRTPPKEDEEPLEKITELI